jgi:hypothetical protein
MLVLRAPLGLRMLLLWRRCPVLRRWSWRRRLSWLRLPLRRSGVGWFRPLRLRVGGRSGSSRLGPLRLRMLLHWSLTCRRRLLRTINGVLLRRLRRTVRLDGSAWGRSAGARLFRRTLLRLAGHRMRDLIMHHWWRRNIAVGL